MDELAKILKSKNETFTHSEQAKVSAQDWVKNKGTDISPMITRVKALKIDHEQ